MRFGDLDLAAGVVMIRERTRAHGRRTMRRVPLSTMPAAIPGDWPRAHPGGPFLFAQDEFVGQSRKRSRTTGHLWKDRPGSERARRAGVKERERPGILPRTEDEARHHFKHTLAGGEWEVVREFHVLRHSFISACASKGVDQRLIDEWVGHQTDEQRRRYRHLDPSVQAEAIRSVFG